MAHLLVVRHLGWEKQERRHQNLRNKHFPLLQCDSPVPIGVAAWQLSGQCTVQAMRKNTVIVDFKALSWNPCESAERTVVTEDSNLEASSYQPDTTDLSRWQHCRCQDVSIFSCGFSHRQSIACPYETVHTRGTSDTPNGVSTLQQLLVLSGSASSPSVRGPKTRTPGGVPPVLQCDKRRQTDAKATRRRIGDAQHAHRWVCLADCWNFAGNVCHKLLYIICIKEGLCIAAVPKLLFVWP